MFRDQFHFHFHFHFHHTTTQPANHQVLTTTFSNTSGSDQQAPFFHAAETELVLHRKVTLTPTYIHTVTHLLVDGRKARKRNEQFRNNRLQTCRTMESEELHVSLQHGAFCFLAFIRSPCLVPRPDCAPSPIFMQIPRRFH